MTDRLRFFQYAAACTVLLLTLGGCFSSHYADIGEGKLSGRVTVEWMEPDMFLYTPNEFEPLTFVRPDGTPIRPVKMPTDGGSIPRPLWALRNYSPWGYGPAFIIHDYLFYMQDCDLEGAEKYDVKEAAIVMSEVMKTMMESGKFDYGDKLTVYLMYQAVQSDIAERAWEEGECVDPDEFERGDIWHPTHVFDVSF